MAYFKVQDIAAIALFAALWGVLSTAISPVIFRVTGLPIFCELVGVVSLILTVWWVRKLGAATLVGIVATIINFVFNPGAIHFLGFTAASIVFDLLVKLTGYNCFTKRLLGGLINITASVLSAAVAGFIIGTFFMAAPALARWGGVLGWALLHAAGGAIGGIIGVVLVLSLETRGLRKDAVF
ncbi:MAG: hypothetical protein ACUVQY_05585 [Thermoproteota archaeon]